jgi:hypothetical protein
MEPNQEFPMAKGNNSHKKETKKPKKEKPKVVPAGWRCAPVRWLLENTQRELHSSPHDRGMDAAPLREK